MKPRLGASARLVFALVALVVPCAAHAGTGAIAGVVTAGPHRAPIANAEVVLRGGEREHRTLTDAEGRYGFTEVESGVTFTLLIRAEGLRPFTRADVAVRELGTVRLDVHMELVEPHYAVEVNDRAPAERGGEASQPIDAAQISELPSITRSVTKFALLDPHVRQAIGLGADFQDSTRLSINAASYRHTGYVVDGMSAYDWIYANAPQVTLSPAAVGEIRVMRGPYSAQYGLSTTGLLSIATAAGGSVYRGDVFLHVRPSAWQAKPPLSPFGVPNSRQDGGFSVSGPLLTPRTFFVATYERAEQDRGAFIQSPQPGFFTGHTREQQGLARFDHRAGESHVITARLNASESTADNANDRVSGFNQASFGRRSHAQSIASLLTDRAVFGRVLNEARVSLVSYVPDSATPLQSSVQVVRPNYSTEGYSTSNWVHARTIQAADQITVTRSRHELRLGGEIVRLHARDYSYTPFGTYTFAPGPPRADEHPTTYTQTFGAADLTYGQTQGSAYIEDAIRLTPRLTTTMGVRYEAQSITDSRKNVGPRGALAWDVTGDGRTVVHGGAGILYDQYYMYLTRRYLTLGPASPQSSYTWSWGDPAFPVFPSSFGSVPTGSTAPARDIMIRGDRLENPYSRQFSVSLEHQVSGRLVLQAGGLASHTFKQMRVNDINHPEPFIRTAANQVRTPQAANQTRPYMTYEGVLVRDIAKIENTAESIYRSLDLGVTRRDTGWGQFGVHYVWSSSIAYSMFYGDANSGVPNEWLPTDDGERGPSDFHQPHRVTADAQLHLPLDFNVAVAAVAASGLPVNPITGRDNNGDSYTVDRPIGFARNSFRGPRQFNVDFALAKRIPLAGTFQSELRLEGFNVTNHRNFIRVNNIYGEGAQPLATFLTPVAGITNADPSRQLQLVVKVLF